MSSYRDRARLFEPHNNFSGFINHRREYSRRQNMSFKSFMGETLLPVLSLLAKRTELALTAMPALRGGGVGPANVTLPTSTQRNVAQLTFRSPGGTTSYTTGRHTPEDVY